MSSKNKAKLLYEEGCNLYLHLFCKKHGFHAKHSDTYWAANDIGGVAFRATVRHHLAVAADMAYQPVFRGVVSHGQGAVFAVVRLHA